MLTIEFIHTCIKPPLKNGLLGSFRLESYMYCSLAQGVVLNVVIFALGLQFSFANGSIGPAWLDILGGLGPTRKELSPLDEHFALLPKNTFSWNVPFLFFCRTACQNDPKMCPNVLL